MHEKQAPIVQNFINHFLLPDVAGKIVDVKELLDLSLSAFKDVSAQELDVLYKNKFRLIRDLSLATAERLEIVSNKYNFNAAKLKKIFVACKLLYLTAQKQNPTEKILITKVILLGLDNAGKTTLIEMLSGKNFPTLLNQEPTASVNQVNVSLQEMNLVVWDFGGQVTFRENYIQNPEQYFTGLEVVMFVIDVQDAARYKEALDFFSQFLEISKFLGENPFVLVLLNKVDPDIRADPEFQINLEYLSGRVREILKPMKYRREVVTSSIYNILSSQPLLVSHLKDLLKTQQVTETNMILLDAMMKMTEMFAQIGNNISQSLDQIQNQNREILGQLTNSIITNNGVKTPLMQTFTPPQKIDTPVSSTSAHPAGWPSDVPFPPPVGWSVNSVPVPTSATPKQKSELEQKVEDTTKPLRNEIMNELRDIFRRRGMVSE